MPNRKLPSDPHACYDYLLLQFLRRRKAYQPLESRNRLIGLMLYAHEHNLLGAEAKRLLDDFKVYSKTGKAEKPEEPVPTQAKPAPEVVASPAPAPTGTGSALDEFED